MEEENKDNQMKEPLVPYTKTLHIFHSFEEQEAHELKEMASFSSIEILQHLRQCINLAYGMHGYNPNNLQKNILSLILNILINECLSSHDFPLTFK